MKVSYDAAYPLPNGVPYTNTVLIYCGGDTPHPWTDAEIAEQPEEYRLPTYVRSDPQYANVDNDASQFLGWLRSHGVPKGSATVLDLETAVDVAYVSKFGLILNNGGYLVLPYGSTSTLFQNPRLNGYFAAEPGATSIDGRCVATQYGFYGNFDLSWINDSVPLWDKNNSVSTTGPISVPTPTPPEDGMNVIAPGNPAPTQRHGQVEVVQSILNGKANAGLKVDGQYGPLTQSAVANWQKYWNLRVDAIVGIATWSSMRDLPYPA